LISRMGVVLWRFGEEVGGGFRKRRTQKGRSAGLSKESAGEASNLMRRPVP
jgi:hypothetical protein